MPKPQKSGSRTRQQRRKETKRLLRRGKKHNGDNFRCYLAVRTALKQFYPGEPTGHLARHLNTSAWMISGIVGSKRTNYPEIAKKCPDGTKPPSREKRFSRWVINDRVDFETYFAPFALALLLSLSQGPLVLAIDGSEVGRGCLALMVSVVYQGRALPLGWMVVKGHKGHFPEETHVALVQEVAKLTPPKPMSSFWGMASLMGSPCSRRSPVTAGTMSVAPPAILC